jgi:hypothetical protein
MKRRFELASIVAWVWAVISMLFAFGYVLMQQASASVVLASTMLQLSGIALVLSIPIAKLLLARRILGADDSAPRYRGMRVWVIGGIVHFTGLAVTAFTNHGIGFWLLVVGYVICLGGFVLHVAQPRSN